MHTLNEKFLELPKSLILYLPRTKYWTDDSKEKLKFAKNREAVEFQDVLYLDDFSSEAANLPTFVENSPLKLGKSFRNLRKRLSGQGPRTEIFFPEGQKLAKLKNFFFFFF